MKITVYDSTQKRLIGYELKCGMQEMACFLGEKKGTFIKGNKAIDFHFDYIVRLDGKHFKIVNPNNTIWCKSSINIPIGAFGRVEGLIRYDS